MTDTLVKSFKIKAFAMILGVSLTLALTGCLPGKEEEKKVVNRAIEATKTVQAEKAVADMVNAAQKLLATSKETTPAFTNTPELRTVTCGNQVVAYIPRTSALAQNGTMPLALASRMKAELQGSMGATNVVERDHAAVACVGDTTQIAENSPVLLMNDDTFAIVGDPRQDPRVVSFSMQPCPANQPGVIVVKEVYNDPKDHKKGTTTVHEKRCGKAIPNSLPNIAVSNLGQVPDYQARLTSSNPIAVARNFKCIVGAKGCLPLTSVSPGTKINCNDTPETRDFVINPTYNNATSRFEPNGGNVDCGRNWSGQLTARVKMQNCTVTRNGKPEPSVRIYDVAYVGAKCAKADVVTYGTCPVGSTFGPKAGSSFPGTGHMLHRESLNMNGTLALTPTSKVDKKNYSSIAYKRYVSGNGPNALGYVDTNMDSETESLTVSPVSVRSVNGVLSETFFPANSNLSAVNNNDFDQAYVTELKEKGKMGLAGTPTCYARAQDCQMDTQPAAIELVLDRSASMAVPAKNKAYESYAHCRATMANLFNPDKRAAACQAAKDWQNVAGGAGLVKDIVDNWKNPGLGGGITCRKGSTGAVNTAECLMSYAKAKLNSNTRNMLEGYENTMKSALRMEGWDKQLMYGLAVGQTCNPPVMGNGHLKVQDNMYGYCMPVTLTLDQMPAYQNGQTTSMCQTSCPGECVIGVDNMTPKTTRLEIADMLIKNTFVPRIPPSADVHYSEIKNDTATAGRQIKVGTNDPGATKNVLSQVPTVSRNIVDGIKTEQGPTLTAGGGKVPLFQSIDQAIERLRDGPLKKDANARASIVIMGSKYDKNCVKKCRSATECFFNDTFVGRMMVGAFNFYQKLSPTNRVLSMFDVDTQIYVEEKDCRELYESPYFGRNICQPEPIPTGYKCRFCGNFGPALPDGTRPCIGMTRERLINTHEVMRDHGVDVPYSREAWCRGYREDIKEFGITVWKLDGSKDLQRIEPVYNEDGGRRTTGKQTISNKPVDNDSSLVGFLGRHYPGVKVYYADFEGGDGLGKLCNQNPNYDHNNAHAFFSGKQIFYGSDAVDMVIQRASEMIEQATGGGEPDPEIGADICRMKYGNNVNIDMSKNFPKPFNSNLTSYTSQQMGSCEGPKVFDPTNGQTGSLPATPLPEAPNGDCVKGVESGSLKSPC